jgi:hypothetical protein
MKASKLATTALTAILIAGAGTAATAQNRHVIIGADVSGSTPLISDSAYAARAGQSVSDMLGDLEPGDRISLRTIGDYGMGPNSESWDWTISRRFPPIKARRTVHRYISALPQLIESAHVTEASSTHLIGFMELESYGVDCVETNTNFVLLTDGVEWSEDTNGHAVMQGKVKLPALTGDQLQGCTLTMLGIGQLTKGSTPAITRNLIKAWSLWAKAAGMHFQPRPGL